MTIRETFFLNLPPPRRSAEKSPPLFRSRLPAETGVQNYGDIVWTPAVAGVTTRVGRRLRPPLPSSPLRVYFALKKNSIFTPASSITS
jgi:hypothetical protein